MEIPDQPIHAVALPPLLALPDLPESADTLSNSGEAEGPPTKKQTSDSQDEDFFDVCFITHETHRAPKSHCDLIDDELRRYDREPKLPSKGDPLQWWGARKVSFPYLYQIALRHLHIPATSVPSERVFSTAGNVVNLKRASLHPDNVDILIFLHHNVKLE